MPFLVALLPAKFESPLSITVEARELTIGKESTAGGTDVREEEEAAAAAQRESMKNDERERRKRRSLD